MGAAVIRTLQQRHPDWIIHNLDLKLPRVDQQVLFDTADITSKADVDAVFAKVKPDVVVHTAGIVPSGEKRYNTSKEVRDWVFGINLGGTQNVMSAAKEHGCKAMVFTSSCTVVSDDLEHDYPYMDETLPVGNATVPYGQSKVGGDS